MKTQKTLWISIVLTATFAIVEFVGGLWSGSLALLSDSAHMASDVLALGLSMVAMMFARKPADDRFTFGYLRMEILASFLNGVTLCVLAIGIFYEGIHRFFSPQQVDFALMMTIAVFGLVINGVVTIVLHRSLKEESNLNVQSALWHFFGDLLSSIGVIIAAVLIRFTGWVVFDPIISIIIGAIIFRGGARITWASTRILMERVPSSLDLDVIRRDIRAIEGVEDVHELHVWAISSDHYSLTAHVFISDQIQPFCVILAINEKLKNAHNIEHVTVQVEHALVHPHGAYGRAFLQRPK
jgi:cobalt-zinc-cadmium efflux system protein